MRDRRRTTCLAQTLSKETKLKHPANHLSGHLGSSQTCIASTVRLTEDHLASSILIAKETCKGVLKVTGYLKRQARMHADEVETISQYASW